MRRDMIARYNVEIVARVMELVDVADSKSAAARRAGSSPASGTKIKAKKHQLRSVLFSFPLYCFAGFSAARKFPLPKVLPGAVDQWAPCYCASAAARPFFVLLVDAFDGAVATIASIAALILSTSAAGTARLHAR
jgi:hypothetical protein